jgi:hypothetical protein
MGQPQWRWCDKCQNLFFAGNNLGVCATGGTHNGNAAMIGSGYYYILLTAPGVLIPDWRWCNKCQDLFFAGNNLGVCATGGTHDDTGSSDYVLNALDGQPGWRWCNKCQGLFFAGNDLGVCPAGDTHDDSGSGDYLLVDAGTTSSTDQGQSSWYWCYKCEGLFFGFNDLGVCPTGDTHSTTGSSAYLLNAGLVIVQE